MKGSCSTWRRVLLGGVLVTRTMLVISCGNSSPGGSGRSDAPANDPTQESSGLDDPAEGSTGQTESASEDDGRPAGWTDETHGDGAPPDYAVVFAEAEVKRLDITIAPEDWQTMQEDMTEMLGEFGQGGGQPGPPPDGPAEQPLPPPPGQPPVLPPEAYEACRGKQEGDDCTISLDEAVPPGVCLVVEDDQLACLPQGGPGPGGDTPGGFGSRDPVYVPCAVEFEGKTWWYVGIRFKGQSTLTNGWRAGVGKLPLRLDFDEFEDDYPEIDDQRFYGFKKLSLANNSHDPSLLREKVGQDLFREAGVPAPYTAFYRVHIDFGEGPVYFGLYTMTEIPDDPMLETQFGGDGGNLYKPVGIGANWMSFDQESFVKKTNEEVEDWSDVEAAIEALHGDRSDAAAWRAGLETTFNVDGFLHWLAVNTLIQKWESYGNMAQNYYVYSDPEDDWRLHWIPWDCNETLKSGSGGPGNQALSLELDEVDDGWPLIRYLIDDPVYRAVYVSHVSETIDGAFAVEPAQARLQAAHDLIAPHVVGADGEQSGYTFLGSPDEFDAELNRILEHVAGRVKLALEFLQGNRKRR